MDIFEKVSVILIIILVGSLIIFLTLFPINESSKDAILLLLGTIGGTGGMGIVKIFQANQKIKLLENQVRELRDQILIEKTRYETISETYHKVIEKFIIEGIDNGDR